MALCKEIDKVKLSRSVVFDNVLRTGTEVVYEGIYRCLGCNAEIVALGGKPMPRPRELAHTGNCASPRWQLLVALGQ